MELYLTGGHAHTDANRRDEWSRFNAAILLKMDVEKQSCTHELSYESPKSVTPDETRSIVFKAGHRTENALHLCTQTEAITYSIPNLVQTDYLSYPSFNDVHHVAISPWNTQLVVVTGLDSVFEFSPDGKELREWNVLGADTWKKFSKDIDYRKVPTTKPHPSHPNYVFFWNDEIFATRHFQDDAVALNSDARTIEIGVGHPHDGEVVGDKVYFTTVNGFVVVSDLKSGKRLEAYDLNEISKADRPLGWCRGIKVISEDMILVGFSRLRMTKATEYVTWLKSTVSGALRSKHAGGRALPTRLAMFDLKSQHLVWEFDLEDYGMHALFSIL